MITAQQAIEFRPALGELFELGVDALLHGKLTAGDKCA
jgi:hypothetical protein